MNDESGKFNIDDNENLNGMSDAPEMPSQPTDTAAEEPVSDVGVSSSESYSSNTDSCSANSAYTPLDLANGGFSYNDPSAAVSTDTKSRPDPINVFAAVVLCLVLAVSAAIGVYCIVSDTVNAKQNIGGGQIYSENNSNGGGKQIYLNSENKPEDIDEKYIDENGRYTTEGIAKYIGPQIVRIDVYNNGVLTSTASGIVLTEDGYIVTNTHLIDNGNEFSVIVNGSEEYDAQVIGRDAKTDIAVIKANASGLSAAVLGNSDEAELGEKVVAIGNPAGFTGSVSEGIISGIDRKIRAQQTGYVMTCIQTDAAMNSGNSGGALINMYGQVIGITSSKYVNYYNMSYEGLGFAIAINDARPIIEEIIANGYVSGRVRIGISFLNEKEYVQEFFKEKNGFDLPKELEGAIIITDISDECDISNTELEIGDLMLKIDGKAFENYAVLNEILSNHKGGDEITADCARVDKDGKVSRFTIKFKLMEDTSGDF